MTDHSQATINNSTTITVPSLVLDSRIIVKNPKTGLILFGKRGRANTPGVSGSLEFPGGGIEPDENSLTCVLRELTEEVTGKKTLSERNHVETLPEPSIVHYSPSDKGGSGREITWECFSYGGPLEFSSPEETFVGLVWTTFEEGLQLVAPQKRAAYTHAYQMCKRVGFL